MKKIFFFASLKSMKKGVGSGSISHRYGSAPKCHGSSTLVKLMEGEEWCGGHTSGCIRGAAGRGGEGATHGRQQVHRLLPRVRGPRSQSRLLMKGLIQGDTKRCRLYLLTNSALRIRVPMRGDGGGGGLRGLSQ
jgi:hypothetical protein